MKRLLVALICSVSVMVGCTCIARAEPYEDSISESNVQGGENYDSGYDSSYDSSYGGEDFQLDEYNDTSGLSEYISNNRPLKKEHLESASRALTPFKNFVSYLIGGAIVLTSIGIFGITALDLIYIGVPPLRGILYKGGNSGGGDGYTQGVYNQGNQGSRGFQLISDEAVQCVASGGSNGGQQSTMTNGYNQQQGGTKSLIISYLKSRMVFMVVFAICVAVLFSSVLMGTGINIGNFINRVIVTINGKF